MNKKKQFFLILMLSFLCLSFMKIDRAYAKTISIEDAVFLALQNSEDFKIVEFNINKAKHVLSQSKSYKGFKADFNINYQGGRINEEGADYVNNPDDLHGAIIQRLYNNDSEFYKLSTGITFSKLIYSFGKIEKQISAAKDGYKIAEIQKQALQRQLKYIAQVSYLSALLADEHLKITQKSYENALNSKKLLQENISRPSKSDIIRISSDIAARKSIINNAEYVKKQSYRALKVLCNIDNSEQVILSSKFEKGFFDISNKENLENLLDNHPELEIYRASMKMHENLASSKKGGKYPNIAFYGGYSKDMNSVEAALDDNMDKTLSYAGISLTIPLWDSGLAKSEYMQEKIEVNKAKLELIKSQKKLKQELDNAIDKYESYVKLYNNQIQTVELAQKTYETSLLRFKAGQTNATELNDVERGLTNAKQSLVNAVFELNLIKRTIEKLTQKISS